jgi:NAD(P)-dependent dehydrogenase (short-subunit alcohol dehydrogenase family)
VRGSAQVDAALAQTVTELGPATILVNNAGGVFHSSILETSENGWDAL